MDSRQLPIAINTFRVVLPNLDVLYPQVYDMKNIASMQKINKNIFNLINMLIMEQGYYENPMTEVVGTYEIKTNERGVLSLLITNYAYIPKHAHGMTINKSLNFDINTGKNYELKELFKENSDYVKILSEYIAMQIKERDIPLLGEFKGIRPDQDYYIADKSLVIYFQLYEIAPYAWGFQYFPISVYGLEDIIAEDGLLEQMLY